MKTRKNIYRSLSILVALALGGTAFAASNDEPTKAKGQPRIEVAFVLDTTGSMSGLIEGAKQKIWSIANEMVSAKPTPELRIGLIGYRDKQDEYVLRTYDLTSDIDAIYGHLRSFSANGGGDTPESVNEALNEAVEKLTWSQSRDVLKIIFLVGDAPPHMDYNGPKYPEICQRAVKKDLVINTVQCGNISETAPIWQQIASLSEGAYASIAQSGNMAVIATPMDKELAELNVKLGTTLVAYGGEALRREVRFKQAASESAPTAVAADRLSYNMAAGVAVQGEGELLDSLAAGKVTLTSVKKDQLPPELRTLNEEALKAEIEKKQKERSEIQARIQQLSKQRADYLEAERKKLAAESKTETFDAKVAAAIQAQAARKGMTYGK